MQLAIGLLFLTAAVAVRGNYVVHVEVVSFHAIGGQLADGTCCDLKVAGTNTCDCPACTPSAHCDFDFHICVEPAREDADPLLCSTGFQKTGAVINNQDAVNFGYTGDAKTFHDIDEPIEDTKTLRMKLTVYDDDAIFNPSDLVDRIQIDNITVANLKPGEFSDTFSLEHVREKATKTILEYRYRINN